MKLLTYTAEKDGNLVEVNNRLMVSEYQINDLLDSLVNNGYTILSTEIGEGDYSPHWNGQCETTHTLAQRVGLIMSATQYRFTT